MRTSTRARLLALAAVALLAGLACSGEDSEPAPSPDAETSHSPNADWELFDLLRRQAAWERSPEDGAGRAWLEEPAGSPPTVVSSTYQRIVFVYEVGETGIAQGGAVAFRVSPRTGWSPPQAEDPERTGYTTVTTEPADVLLQAEPGGVGRLRFRVVGRALEPGERLRITYGAGKKRARAGRFAAAWTRIWISVDGNGDGVARNIADSPRFEIAPGPATSLVATVPGVARPGERVRVTIAVLDRWANAGVVAEGILGLESEEGFELPASVPLPAGSGGRVTVEGRVDEPGVYRVRVQAGPLSATSNPLLVSEDAPRVLWADLHGHSVLSDGTGTPEDYFRYARDVAGLDVVALTDHDHHGPVYLDEHPENWKLIQDVTRSFHAPGSFVTIPGYEWTSWIHGHRHVLYFEEGGAIHSSVAPGTISPRGLWRALEGSAALTFAHHSAAGPVATNWEIEPDPNFEPVTEIVSTHGSSESADSPKRSAKYLEGNGVRDVLDRGYRLGFVGSGDGHNGHPGLVHLRAISGGLAGILSEERTREGVHDALRARRTYATSGPRILLDVRLGGRPMGSVISASEAEGAELAVRVIGETALDRVDLVSGGAVAASVPADGRLELAFRQRVAELVPGDYLYVRAVQADEATAWSSPFFIVE